VSSLKNVAVVTIIIMTMLITGCVAETVQITEKSYSSMYEPIDDVPVVFSELSSEKTSGDSTEKPKCGLSAGDEQTDKVMHIDGVDESLGVLVDIEDTQYFIESRRFYIFDDENDNYIDIVYPQIGGISDGFLTERINLLLHDTAFYVLTGYGNNVTGLKNFVTFEIAWAGEMFLSVKFDIYFFGKRAAYYNELLFTANIDMRTGEPLRLTDFFVIDDRFVDVFRTCAIIDSVEYHIFQEAYEYVLCYSDEELARVLGEADNPLEQSSFRDYSSYFTDNTLGISFGTLHALGTYAEVVISYHDLLDCIATENDIWRELNSRYD